MTSPFAYTAGEISRADINVLIGWARKSPRILEFGSGGSTLLFAQFAPPVAHIVSVDTKTEWHAKTQSKLDRLGMPSKRVHFLPYGMWRQPLGPRPWFDFVFVDGQMEMRAEFARAAWPLLAPTGIMAFHDGRWPNVAHMSFELALNSFLEVGRVDVNVDGSNLIAIQKRVEIVAINDHEVEGREPWMTGYADPPEGWPPTR